MFLLLLYSIFITTFVVLLLLGLYQKNTNAICKSKRRLDGKTVIVTGGTAGMGLEIAVDSALRGAKVIIACPFEEEGRTGKEEVIKRSGNENVTFLFLDLSSFASVRKFAANILENESRLDVLVNNAGINSGERLTEDGFNIVFQVNYLGTVLLTLLLLPLLKKSGFPKEPSRIVNTTSVTHKLGQVNFGGWQKTSLPKRRYFNAKLCIALFTRELAKRIKDSHVIVNVVDPGIVGTRIYKTCTNRILGPIVVSLATYCSKNTWEGAQTAIHTAVCGGAREESGKYFCNGKVSTTVPIPAVFDDRLSEALWEKTMAVLNFKE